MSQVYIAAGIFSLLALAGWRWIVRKSPTHVPAPFLWLIFILCLPLEPLSFYCMRLPLINLVKANWPAVLPHLALAWAPLTEDTFKLLPLALPQFRQQLNEKTYALLALAIGFGFGIGEGWLVGYLMASDPKVAGYPFYYYGGYIGERLQVCILHAYFTSWALRAWGPRFPIGVLMAMSLHYLLNAPIIFIRLLPPGFHPVVLVLYSLLLLGVTLYAASQLAQAILGPVNLARLILGRARCPECQQVYDRPWLAANLGPKRYERCPHCKKWHMSGQEDSVSDQEGALQAPSPVG